MQTISKLIVIHLLIFIINDAQAQNFKWAKSMGSTGDDNGRKLTIDANGDIIVCGTFTDILDADPGPAQYNMTPVGVTDIFVEKLDSSGNMIWAGSIGCANYNLIINDIKTDDQNAIYITGAYQGSGDFDPGPGVFILPAEGGLRAFFMKLDPAGDLIWVKGIGTGFTTSGKSIDTDENGYVYVTGKFSGLLDINPDTAVTNYYNSQNGEDSYLIKFDSIGNFVWGFTIGGTSIVNSTYLQYRSGKIFLTGFYSPFTDFDPGAGSTILVGVSGNPSTFIAVYDTSSLLEWAIGIYETEEVTSNMMVIDQSGNIFISGFFVDSTDFDPSSGTATITCDDYSGFVASYDSNGVYRWVNWFGDTGNTGNSALGVEVDNSGNIYYTGFFNSTVDFDPGPGVAQLSADSLNTFLCSVDNNGNFRWVRAFTDVNNEIGYDIAFTPSFDFYFTGNFSGTLEADSATNVSLVATGKQDAFVMKFGDLISATNEIATLSGDVAVYPNPSQGKMCFTGFDPSLNYTISVYDISGKILKTFFYGDSSEIEIDLNLPTGQYNVRIESPDEVIVSRVLIVR